MRDIRLSWTWVGLRIGLIAALVLGMAVALRGEDSYAWPLVMLFGMPVNLAVLWLGSLVSAAVRGTAPHALWGPDQILILASVPLNLALLGCLVDLFRSSARGRPPTDQRDDEAVRAWARGHSWERSLRK